MLHQNALGLPGDGRRRIDHTHTLSSNLLDQRDYKGEMRASHHERINAFGKHRLQGLLQDAAGEGCLEVTAFYLFYKPRAGGLKDLDVFGKAFHHGGIQFSLKSGWSRQHANLAA